MACQNYVDNIENRCNFINYLFHQPILGIQEHKYLYDFEEIQNSLALAGFKKANITKKEDQTSKYKELNNLRNLSEDEQSFELIIEVVK